VPEGTYTLTVCFQIKGGTEAEVRTLAQLSGMLPKTEWKKVLRRLGRERILALPIAVLKLTMRARIEAGYYNAKTVGELAEISVRALEARLVHHTVIDGIQARLDLFDITMSQ